jgi:ribonuclease BN (tRNA processing enzyme)
MQIKLWGVRGSLPSPLTNEEYSSKLQRILKLAIDKKIKTHEEIDSFLNSLPNELRYTFGGDTTCVTVRSSSGRLYILDCGTGVRRVGNMLMEGACAQGKGEINIMFTHNHWDHIQGLPFFRPIYVQGNILNFYSPYKNQKECLEKQMTSPFFPATFEGTPSIKNYFLIDHAVHEPIILEEDLKVSIYPLKHPQGCYAYKFEQNGKIFIFATDTEFTGEIIERMDNKTNFFKNADLLILDSQYTLNEAFLKVDWGHTSYTMAVNCAANWNVKKLVMTHHEPAYSDDLLQENYLLALEHAQNLGGVDTEILLAVEGMVFEL